MSSEARRSARSAAPIPIFRPPPFRDPARSGTRRGSARLAARRGRPVTGIALHPAPRPPAEQPAAGLGPLGAHISAAGGVSEAAARAKAIGATAMQIFTKQASRWAERMCADDECIAFRAGIAATEVRRIAAHDSYLINLASPDPVLRARSLASFIAELRRSDALGIDSIVSHPGNYMDDRPSGLARNIEAIVSALEQAP